MRLLRIREGENTHTDRQTDIQTYRQTDRQTYRQTYRQTDRHTDIQTDRQTYRQTDRHTDRQTHRQTYRQTTAGGNTDREHRQEAVLLCPEIVAPQQSHVKAVVRHPHVQQLTESVKG